MNSISFCLHWACNMSHQPNKSRLSSNRPASALALRSTSPPQSHITHTAVSSRMQVGTGLLMASRGGITSECVQKQLPAASFTRNPFLCFATDQGKFGFVVIFIVGFPSLEVLGDQPTNSCSLLRLSATVTVDPAATDLISVFQLTDPRRFCHSHWKRSG